MPILRKRNEPVKRTTRGADYKHTYDTVYNTQRWRNVRKQYLLRNPLCIECLHEGTTKEATVLDHIIPISKGGDSWDNNNFQALCAIHHNRKTMTTDRQSQQATVNVVFGPPCSGKSTYIQSHIKQGEILIDIDALSKATIHTPNPRTRTPHQAKVMLSARDAMVRAMLPHQVTIWIPTTYTHAGIFKGLDYTLIPIETTKEQCLQYLTLSDRDDHLHQRTLINEWFDKQDNLKLLEI